MAFLIYGYLLLLSFTFYNLIKKKKEIMIKNSYPIFIINFLLITLILITIGSGGLVAGLDAGLVYNTFPKMGDRIVPQEIFDLKPLYLNFFENPVTVQFNHRILGFLSLITGILLLICSKTKQLPKQIHKKIILIVLMIILQIILGVATLLNYVPIYLAISHQLGALILFSLLLWTLKSLPLMPK